MMEKKSNIYKTSKEVCRSVFFGDGVKNILLKGAWKGSKHPLEKKLLEKLFFNEKIPRFFQKSSFTYL